MSRHTLPSTADPELDIAVGWDPPMQTFFAQVRDPRIEEDGDADPVIFWTGTQHFEHRGVQGLRVVIDLLAPWAEVPEGLRRQLLDDESAGWDGLGREGRS